MRRVLNNYAVRKGKALKTELFLGNKTVMSLPCKEHFIRHDLLLGEISTFCVTPLGEDSQKLINDSFQTSPQALLSSHEYDYMLSSSGTSNLRCFWGH